MIALHLLLVGMSHHSASIELRERLSCAEYQLPAALAALTSAIGVVECALLSTCNRTEVYACFDTPSAETGYAALIALLAAFHNLPQEDL